SPPCTHSRYTTSSTCRSASLIRNSPDMSLGNNAFRNSANVQFSICRVWIDACNGPSAASS
ncbi:MAG: hypothetical protein ACRDQ5_08945, partial [Sciscionella sp.]